MFKEHVSDFEAALALFDFCQAQLASVRENPNLKPIFRWPFIAARDGAMSIYHAYTILDGIRQSLATTTELAELVDRKALKAAGNIFHSHFQSFEDVRDAVAHIGEKMGTPAKFDRHSFSGSFEGEGIKADDVKGLTLSNHLAGRRYSNSWRNKVLTYELSGESLDRLDEARRHLWAAFRPAEAETRTKTIASRS
jgi:hypothetical protein